MKLNYLTKLNIPGYSISENEKYIYQYDIIERDSILWFNKFKSRINDSINKKYLPIYRMADGEFIFTVGVYPEKPLYKINISKLIIYFLKYIYYSIKKIFKKEVVTCWGEKYNKYEIISAKKKYIENIKLISSSGYLALHFNKSPSRFSEQYIRPMIRWFITNKINLNAENYIPFYFVYAFLCGVEGKLLLKDKNILIITSANEEKWNRINIVLINDFNVKSASHLNISSTNSMGDMIDIENQNVKNADIILVSAGIGSINILAQLHPIKTVCIDSGIFIEILAGNDARSRIFTNPSNS